MASRDGRLFNVDRWTIYTLQRLYPNQHFKGRKFRISFSAEHLPMTPKQRRRCLKKMRKHNDYSIGVSVGVMAYNVHRLKNPAN